MSVAFLSFVLDLKQQEPFPCPLRSSLACVYVCCGLDDPGEISLDHEVRRHGGLSVLNLHLKRCHDAAMFLPPQSDFNARFQSSCFQNSSASEFIDNVSLGEIKARPCRRNRINCPNLPASSSASIPSNSSKRQRTIPMSAFLSAPLCHSKQRRCEAMLPNPSSVSFMSAACCANLHRTPA